MMKKLLHDEPPPKDEDSRLKVIPSESGMEGEAVVIDKSEVDEEELEKLWKSIYD